MSQECEASASLLFPPPAFYLWWCSGNMGSQKDYNEICHIKTRLSLLFFWEICRERSCLLAVEFAKDTIFWDGALCQQTECPRGNGGEKPRLAASIHHMLISTSPKQKYSVRVQRVGAGGTESLKREWGDNALHWIAGFCSFSVWAQPDSPQHVCLLACYIHGQYSDLLLSLEWMLSKQWPEPDQVHTKDRTLQALPLSMPLPPHYWSPFLQQLSKTLLSLHHHLLAQGQMLEASAFML